MLRRSFEFPCGTRIQQEESNTEAVVNLYPRPFASRLEQDTLASPKSVTAICTYFSCFKHTQAAEEKFQYGHVAQLGLKHNSSAASQC